MRFCLVLLHMCVLCMRLGWGKTVPAQPLEVTYCCHEGEWWHQEQEECLKVEGRKGRMTGTMVVVGGRHRTLYSGGVKEPKTGRGMTVSPVNIGGAYTKRKPGGGSQAVLTDYGGLSVFFRTITRKVEGEYCLSRDFTQGEEGSLVAVYWDQCQSQVLCHYTGILFDELIAGSEDNFIKNQFSSADSDQDGRVYFEELLDKIEEDVRFMFGVLDTNYDKSISDEIQAGLIVPRYSLEFLKTAVHVYFASLYNMDFKEDRNTTKWNTRENVLDFIKRMFFLIDTNIDGLVDEKEVESYLKRNFTRRLQLKIKLLLQKYFTIARFLMEEFVEKADTNQDGRVTVDEVIGFENFDFIASSFETVKEFGKPLDPDITSVLNTPTTPRTYSTKNEETYEGQRLGFHY